MLIDYNVKSPERLGNTELAVDDEWANIANVIPQKQIYFIIFSLCRANGGFNHVNVSI